MQKPGALSESPNQQERETARDVVCCLRGGQNILCEHGVERSDGSVCSHVSEVEVDHHCLS